MKECHAPLFAGAADKVAAASTGHGLVHFGSRAVRAWARLVPRFFGAGPRDVVVVGYTGHLDLYLARALSLAWRRPLVLDAFLSPYDTVVGDRRLLAKESLLARALFALERLPHLPGGEDRLRHGRVAEDRGPLDARRGEGGRPD